MRVPYTKKLYDDIEKHNEDSLFVVVLSKTDKEIIMWTGEDIKWKDAESELSDLDEIFYEHGYDLKIDNPKISTVYDYVAKQIKPCLRVEYGEWKD